jgi:hypothetical protein
MLQIDVQTNVSLLTPLLNNLVPNLPIHFEGQRTIVSYISLPNRYSVDRDFDGLLDAWETANFGNISLTGTDDPDFDRCNNGCEESRGTNPNVADTDGDNLLDGEEAYIYQTNPLLQDTDGDGLNDDAEIACGTAPVSIDGVPSDSRDTDSDGVWDHIECGWGLPWAPGADFDGDGLNDAQEIAYGTIPYNPDSDGDTISDGAEVYGSPTTNPTLADSDSDDLRDDVELARGTNPNDPDTDGDGLPDGQEANAASTRFGPHTNTSPLSTDTDGDGLNDKLETDYQPVLDDTDPNDPDTDRDGLNDGDEVQTYHTYANSKFTDADSLEDGQEVTGGTPLPAACPVPGVRPPTNPLLPDTDGDGINDDADCTPVGADDDLDGLADGWEYRYFPGDLTVLTMPADYDGDGCDNECEENRDLNPVQSDTDGDGLNDGFEIALGTNPLIQDTDRDGLTDGQEVSGVHPVSGSFNASNPNLYDTDIDGLGDGEEVLGQRPIGVLHGLGASDPTVGDTDNDGLTDLREVTGNAALVIIVNGNPGYPMPPTFPSNPDSDGDTIADGVEVDGIPRTNPRLSDTDGDGLDDKQEQTGNASLVVTTIRTDSTCSATQQILSVPATDPLRSDTDGDGLSDSIEVNRQVAGTSRPTNPVLADSDGDGVVDKAELDGNANRFVRVNSATPGYAVPATNPLTDDTDSDCVRDSDEINRTAGSPAVAAPTDPTKADTDNDGLNDGVERLGRPTLFIRVNGATPGYSVPATDPLKSDTDGDTLSDSAEINRTTGIPAVPAPTDPTRADTDLDGMNDNTDADPLNSPPPILRITGATVAEPDSSTTLQFPVTLLYPRSGVTAYVTATTSTGGANGNAVAGTECKNNRWDYITTSAVLPFPPGTTTVMFAVTICGDNDNKEANETFTVTLSAASNAAIDVASATGTITP